MDNLEYIQLIQPQLLESGGHWSNRHGGSDCKNDCCVEGHVAMDWTLGDWTWRNGGIQAVLLAVVQE